MKIYGQIKMFGKYVKKKNNYFFVLERVLISIRLVVNVTA